MTLPSHHLYLRPRFPDNAEWKLPGEHDPLFFYVTIDNDIVTLSTGQKFLLVANLEYLLQPIRLRRLLPLDPEDTTPKERLTKPTHHLYGRPYDYSKPDFAGEWERFENNPINACVTIDDSAVIFTVDRSLVLHDEADYRLHPIPASPP